MDLLELRLECLRLAVSSASPDPINTAKAMEEYVNAPLNKSDA